MLTSHDEQIIQAHATFICQVVQFAQSSATRPQFDALMKTAEESGWNALAAALRLVALIHTG